MRSIRFMCSVSPSVSALLTAAFVEGSHRLISRPSLNLHEIRPVVAALWTSFYKRQIISRHFLVRTNTKLLTIISFLRLKRKNVIVIQQEIAVREIFLKM